METRVLPHAGPVSGLMPGLPMPEVKRRGARLLTQRVLARPRNRAVPDTLPGGTPFRSFWIAGYDDAKPRSPVRGHSGDDCYSPLLEFGIRTVRETADWARIDRGGPWDLQSLEERSRKAKDLGVQVTWTLLDRTWPDDVGVLSAAFVKRFARYASAVATRVAAFDPSQVPVFAPINEPSFLAWSLYSRGNVRRADGSKATLGEIKRQLARASIAACEAILSRLPNARLLHTDPLEHVVAPVRNPAMVQDAARRTELQFEAWDWIAGRSSEDLGGKARYLDLIGVHYYVDNQWELGSGRRLGWQIDDPRRVPLSRLLDRVHSRYARPVTIAETGHFGVRRGSWIRELASEVRHAQRLGVAIDGICLHRAIEYLDAPYAAALRVAQKSAGGPPAEMPVDPQATAIHATT